MKNPTLFIAVILLLSALLCNMLCLTMEYGGGEQGQGSITNITVMGTVFCDACSASSFSNHSYFLPGVKVRVNCMIKVNSTSKEEIAIVAEKITNNYGVYELDIPAINGFECKMGRETESFCRATLLDNPSTLCNVPTLTNSVGHISLANQEGNACFYNLNALYYRPSKKNTNSCEATISATLNTSLFFWPFFPPFGSPWPHWPKWPFPFPSPPSFPFPHIPFFTPPPSFHFPPIPFFTPPPPSFPFPLPPLPHIPFFTPPPPPSFPFPFPPWPWTPPTPKPPSFSFPPFPPIFAQPPPPPPPPSFHFPFPPSPHLPPFLSWFSSPPPPPPPPLPPPSFPWPFPPLPFFSPNPASPSPPPPPSRFSWKDPRTWFPSHSPPPPSHNQP